MVTRKTQEYTFWQLLNWKVLLFFFLFIAGAGYGFYWLFGNFYRFIPTKMDAYIGEVASLQYAGSMKKCTDPKSKELVVLLQRAMSEIKPKESSFQYKITVLRHDQANAFALPGGNIFIFSGLIQRSSALQEVVGVLAHEMAHVELRHGMQQIGRAMSFSLLVNLFLGGAQWLEGLAETGTMLTLLRYSRQAEYEADRYAIQYLHAAGIAASGLADFLSKVQGSENQPEANSFLQVISTHPDTQKRVAAIRQAEAAKTQKVTPSWILRYSQWEKAKQICLD